MKIITFNANGIRAAQKKGFFNWLKKQNADVVCIQETKAQIAQLQNITDFFPLHHNHYFDAQKKGYSGVALYLKNKPKNINYGIGWDEIDSEGRWISAQYEDLLIISLYMHSGTSGEIRQNEKETFMHKLLPYLNKLAQNKQKVILCGDINIAHKEIDIKNWKQNLNSSGFLPQERKWMDELFINYKDAFRLVNQNTDQFSWWSQRSKTARANNVGWRIDYQIITNNLVDTVKNAYIYKEEAFSDHAPVIIEYDLQLNT